MLCIGARNESKSRKEIFELGIFGFHFISRMEPDQFVFQASAFVDQVDIAGWVHGQLFSEVIAHANASGVIAA
jgi:hypothetical protein